MSGTIYIVQDEGRLVEMTEHCYDSEASLPDLLARYPKLLAGEQIDEADPQRWVLVSREMGVPWEEGDPDQMALDHLFLDQDGIPTPDHRQPYRVRSLGRNRSGDILAAGRI